MTTSFDKFIAEFREKREKASLIYHSKMKHMINYLCGNDEVGDYVIAGFNRSMPNWKSDVEFCQYSANNITKLLEAAQIMKDALSIIEANNGLMSDASTNEVRAKIALFKVEELLK